MVVRVFRARVRENLRQDFEEKFLSISIPLVKSQPGFVSVQVGRPVPGSSEDYVMLSVWKDERAVKDFVGEDWNQGHIPSGMEIHVEECWVHHYELFG